jgi:hypothetical protein
MPISLPTSSSERLRCPGTVSLGKLCVVQKLAENPLLRDRGALNRPVRYAGREFL